MRILTMFGLVGMGGGFLLISPPLRDSLMQTVTKGETLLSANEPYSGLGLGACMLVALGCYMYRCTLPR